MINAKDVLQILTSSISQLELCSSSLCQQKPREFILSQLEAKPGFPWSGGSDALNPLSTWGGLRTPQAPNPSWGTEVQAELLAHPNPPICGRARIKRAFLNLALLFQLHKAITQLQESWPIPCWLRLASTLTDKSRAACSHQTANNLGTAGA